jgi:hypothetical protein
MHTVCKLHQHVACATQTTMLLDEHAAPGLQVMGVRGGEAERRRVHKVVPYSTGADVRGVSNGKDAREAASA